MTECDKKLFEDFIKFLKSIVKEIREFKTVFVSLNESQMKHSSDLWKLALRYGVLNNAAPCVYPILEKEEILTELMVEIQEKSLIIQNNLSKIKSKFDNLIKLHKVLKKNSSHLNWNPAENPSVKGSTRSSAPSKYLEEVADLIYQYDIAITCMFHYFDALSLQDAETYRNLMNSFSISKEVTTATEEFLIKSTSFMNS